MVSETRTWPKSMATLRRASEGGTLEAQEAVVLYFPQVHEAYCQVLDSWVEVFNLLVPNKRDELKSMIAAWDAAGGRRWEDDPVYTDHVGPKLGCRPWTPWY